jgi:hypothetical protein
MSAEEFRAALKRLGFNQSTFARRLIELGDPRSFSAVIRNISNYCRGATSVPGEMSVILTLLECCR